MKLLLPIAIATSVHAQGWGSAYVTLAAYAKGDFCLSNPVFVGTDYVPVKTNKSDPTLYCRNWDRPDLTRTNDSKAHYTDSRFGKSVALSLPELTLNTQYIFIKEYWGEIGSCITNKSSRLSGILYEKDKCIKISSAIYSETYALYSKITCKNGNCNVIPYADANCAQQAKISGPVPVIKDTLPETCSYAELSRTNFKYKLMTIGSDFRSKLDQWWDHSIIKTIVRRYPTKESCQRGIGHDYIRIEFGLEMHGRKYGECLEQDDSSFTKFTKSTFQAFWSEQDFRNQVSSNQLLDGGIQGTEYLVVKAYGGYNCDIGSYMGVEAMSLSYLTPSLSQVCHKFNDGSRIGYYDSKSKILRMQTFSSNNCRESPDTPVAISVKDDATACVANEHDSMRRFTVERI